MKVFVTGHLGYIGPQLVDLLLADGHEVTGLDLDLFPESRLYPEPVPTESRIGDLLDLEPADLAGFDAVMHLAGISNDAMGMLNPELTWRVNFEGTLHGIRLCYGRATGYNTYGREGFPRGARLIELREGERAFSTWLRLEGGEVVPAQPEHAPEGQRTLSIG